MAEGLPEEGQRKKGKRKGLPEFPEGLALRIGKPRKASAAAMIR